METPTKDNIIKAYNVAKEQGADGACKALETLYPDIDFSPVDNRPITERIKTFEDAVAALGESHILVQTYRDLGEFSTTIMADENHDMLAYAKLRIIAAALNEGWEPEFTGDSVRWYPWFGLYTKDELEEKDEDWKQCHTVIDIYDVVSVSSGNSEYGRFAFENVARASLHADGSNAAQLAFKNEKLAWHAGQIFTKLYADLILFH